jgi:hypothetical protein
MKTLNEMASLRPATADNFDHRVSDQPGPYFALDAGPVRLVALDMGVSGSIDHRQAEWLRRTSAEPGPKILVLDRPPYVDGLFNPQPIPGGQTIHEIVTNASNQYIAVISGNTHNYQRYMVSLGDGREMPFIVSGGGGAFLHETHTIPNLDEAGIEGVDEGSFRCYPMRGDSLARCAQLWDLKLGGHGVLSLDPDTAARIAADRISAEPVREAAREARPSRRDRAVAELMYRAPGRPHLVLHSAFSALLDWGEPPLFKHFLRIEAEGDEVSIACHAVTGCSEHAGRPPLIEDRLTAKRKGDVWRWETDAQGGGRS